jgi:two-component system cell cycle response regulator DivK
VAEGIRNKISFFLIYSIRTGDSLDMNSPKILYIEDNPENRLLVRRILEAEGYNVVEAVDGPSGLDLAAASPPDLILLDINLPEMDGYELVGRLRQIPGLANTPIIALTAYALRGDRERILAAGCDGYIQKPIDVDSLPVQVASFLKKRAG